MATIWALLPRLREVEGAFADIHKLQPHAVEAGVGMLIEQPHALGRVDGRAAAQGDDDVGLEGVHGLYAAS